jgi:putative hydrolase of the HAD superfamily
MIETALFDIGNVLLRWAPSEVIANHGFDVARTLPMTFGGPTWLALDRGDLTESEAVTIFARDVGCTTEAMTHLVEAAKEAMAPLEEGLALLDSFKREGRRLIALSNMSRETFAFIREKFAFFDVFDAFVVSGHIQLMKPEPEIYRYAIETHRLDPSRTLFVDDHPPNIAAAIACGLRGVVWDGSERAKEEVAILRASALSLSFSGR